MVVATKVVTLLILLLLAQARSIAGELAQPSAKQVVGSETNNSASAASTTETQFGYFVPEASPKSYDEPTLRKALRKLLSADEIKLVVDPMERTPEMDQWARNLTKDATNEMEKATTIFAVLRVRASNSSLISNEHYHTAREIFAEWNNPAFVIRCQEATYFYVTMARAVGLQAFVADVHKRFDGGMAPHACSAVYLDGRRFLVDTAFGWFGVPHPDVQVLDDVQATAAYNGCGASLEQRQIAAKLGPDLAIVRYNLCLLQIRSGLWDGARMEYAHLVQLDRTGIFTNTIEVEFALKDHDWDKAVTSAKKGMAMVPEDAWYRLQLGAAYSAQGKLDEAQAAFQGALTVTHTTQQAVVVSNALQQIESVRHGAR